MKNRIFIDSSVLVSASVLVSRTDINPDLKIMHQFYEECKELFTFIQKNLVKRIGIVTSTVENESLGVLDKVIEGELRRKGYSRTEDFTVSSAVFNICESNMRNLINVLQREPINPVDVARKFILITVMYEEFTAMARNLPKVAAAKTQAVTNIAKGAVKWFNLFKTQDHLEHAQLYKLLTKDVEPSDIQILAEASHLYNNYIESEGKGGALFVASKDGHFAPIRKEHWTIEGREITDEIQKRFGIICEHPRKIKDQLAKR